MRRLDRANSGINRRIVDMTEALNEDEPIEGLKRTIALSRDAAAGVLKPGVRSVRDDAGGREYAVTVLPQAIRRLDAGRPTFLGGAAVASTPTAGPGSSNTSDGGGSDGGGIAFGRSTADGIVVQIFDRRTVIDAVESGDGVRVADAAGQMIAPEGVRRPATLSPSLDEAVRGGFGEDLDGRVGPDGVRRVAAWRYLPEHGLAIAAETDRDRAYAATDRVWYAVGPALAAAAVLAAIPLVRSGRGDRTSSRGDENGDGWVGRMLGHYRIIEPIAAGGMGMVFRGRHRWLERDVAIKVLGVGSVGGGDRHAESRFERETRLTARLRHPNTIAVFDSGRDPDGVFYYVMELIEGWSLQELVDRDGAQPPARVIHLLLQVCGSLSEAHAAGLIHRDVKPANILVCGGAGLADVVKVVDFGLVKDVIGDRDESLTRHESLTGTPMYMSPEAVRDATAANTQSDLYSVAAVGYTLLAGRPMFQAATSVDVCLKQLNEHPSLPEEFLGAPLPNDLQTVLMTALRKDPSDRWRSIDDFSAALRRCRDAGRWTSMDAERWWADRGRSELEAGGDAAEGAVPPPAESAPSGFPTGDRSPAGSITAPNG